MSRDGLTYEQFSAAIKRLAPTLASTISGAPPFDATWADGCKRRFGEVYMEQQAGRTLRRHNLSLRLQHCSRACPS